MVARFSTAATTVGLAGAPFSKKLLDDQRDTLTKRSEEPRFMYGSKEVL